MNRRHQTTRILAVSALTLLAVVASVHPASAQLTGGTLDFSTPLCAVWTKIRTVTGPLALIGIVAGLAALLVGGGDDHHSPFKRMIYIAVVLTLISGAPYILSLFPGVTSC